MSEENRRDVTALPPTPGSVLRGLKWKAVINGRKCINGARYSATITGEIEASEEWSTIYDVMHDLAEHLESHNREMGLPDSFQITLYPPNSYYASNISALLGTICLKKSSGLTVVSVSA